MHCFQARCPFFFLAASSSVSAEGEARGGEKPDGRRKVRIRLKIRLTLYDYNETAIGISGQTADLIGTAEVGLSELRAGAAPSTAGRAGTVSFRWTSKSSCARRMPWSPEASS